MSDYAVYIDEAGDLGIGRGTRWFVLTAVVVKKTVEPQIRARMTAIKACLNVREIHLRKITEFYKRAAGAASSLALLAPEAPDAAALLYKVSTAALTVAAAYGWPGGRCFARLVGWFCAGNLLLAGALLLPGAQTNNGCIYLPLSPGALLAGAGGVVLAVQGVLRFLGRGGGQVFPARLTVADTALDVRAFCDTGFSVQEPLSGRAVVLVRFGAVQGRLPPALGTYLEQHFAGAAPLPVPALGVRLVPCTTVAGHCILPAVPASLCCTGSPAGQGMAEHLYAAFADLPPPPDGWEVLVGSETVSSLAHG